MKAGSKSGRTWKVLLADDNDDHALLIQMALERVTDGEVVLRRARDGDEAVRMVAEELPELILLDLHMPGRSGHEVLQHLNGSQEYRRIPVAVRTSSDRDEDVAESYGLGGNHFITKPGDPAELVQRLRPLFTNLRELQGISRGARGMATTGKAAEGPASYVLKKAIPAIGFIAVLAILLFWAWVSGVF
ncbi:MAG: response regulator [Gemmatimonadetes bacterium]|nr:response regulator [Gemmatimonadota bacterium]